MDLNQLRKEINDIDKSLLELFQKRMDTAIAIGQYKKGHSMQVLDENREKEVIQRAKASAEEKYQDFVEAFYENLMALSREIQREVLNESITLQIEASTAKVIEKPTVVFQGVKGSYSDEALSLYFGDNVTTVNVQDFEDVFEVLKEGSADYGILPVENSSTGSIVDVFDLLAKHDCYIVGEQLVKVEQCLLGVKGSTIEDIREIYSHPQGFSQSTEFLKKFPDCLKTPYYNTAISAKFVAESKDKAKAAIAGKRAASIYGLDILAENINTSNDNYTRFITISKKLLVEDASNKVSVMFILPHESGSLYNVLTYFARNNLNMLNIESRPIPNKNWEYMFFLDFQGNLNDQKVKNTLADLSENSSFIKVLGNYRSAMSKLL